LAFLPGVAEKLGYYVYALRDPTRSGAIFYVGKGQGDRVYQHARHARKVDPGQSAEELKLAQIRAVHAARRQVGVEIIRHRLPNEATALEVEAAVIDALKLAGAKLTNLVAGHGVGRGWQPLGEIVAAYSAKPVEIEHRVMLIRIPNLYKPGITPEALYKATRQDWRIASPTKRRPERQPEYAFAVHRGIVRAVYRIKRWREDPRNQVGHRPRWAFVGEPDPAMEERYVWGDVGRYLPAGAANPIRYVNC